jgi:hypothetical protein
LYPGFESWWLYLNKLAASLFHCSGLKPRLMWSWTVTSNGIEVY